MISGLACFAVSGRFRRGNVHGHSSMSDGRLAPADACALYKEAGYDFVALTDHFLPRYGFPLTDTRPFRSEGFTTVLGAELHAPANSHGELWHVLAVGLPLDFRPTRPDESGVALAQRAAEAGAFVGIAHPHWSGLTVEDARALGCAHAVEVYNHSSALECGRGDGFSLWDTLLNEGRRVFAYAADDSHCRIDDFGGGWVMVSTAANEPDLLVEALKRGEFYSSQGPTIRSAGILSGTLVVECSPAMTVAALGRGTRYVSTTARDITRAELPLEAFAGDWFRVIVRDHAGLSAWTNPVWIDHHGE